ncbi:MAG: abortive infection family protein [Phycisphaeraceae bacterium]|nr:abortive infection family protein [Phycisphaeraceae bacterium]
MDHVQRTLLLTRAIESTFNSSDWTEVGLITGTRAWIDSHSRLLRSLSWGDSDYKGHVIDAVEHILGLKPDNLRVLLDFPKLAQWMREREPDSYARLLAEVTGAHVASVVPRSATNAAAAALADAEVLLRARNPTSALDRIHTGLHAFLKGACDSSGITYPPDLPAGRLLRLLLEQHRALQLTGSQHEAMRTLLRAAGAMIDALGTIRNNASLAHPNDDLLDYESAIFAINLARSVMRFMDARLAPSPETAPPVVASN